MSYFYCVNTFDKGVPVQNAGVIQIPDVLCDSEDKMVGYLMAKGILDETGYEIIDLCETGYEIIDCEQREQSEVYSED